MSGTWGNSRSNGKAIRGVGTRRARLLFAGVFEIAGSVFDVTVMVVNYSFNSWQFDKLEQFGRILRIFNYYSENFGYL